MSSRGVPCNFDTTFALESHSRQAPLADQIIPVYTSPLSLTNTIIPGHLIHGKESGVQSKYWTLLVDMIECRAMMIHVNRDW